ncbi:MAG: AbrB/MazE/SpoVT family DNA-binding domain-containing protein [Luteitalea sp.]|nr:AbrB/MazE/SpoVT family DNA-binding domain-containing protein [Luteitalea sp.]
MRLTTKGQVTIPLAIRQQLGLLPSTEVVFDVVENSVRIRKASGQQTRGSELIRRMRAVGARQTSSMTTDEILALTREY